MNLLLVFIFLTASVFSQKFSPFDSPDFCSQNITPTCNTTFSYIDELNSEIRPYLSDLVKTSYFRYFKLNFEKQCKFWNAQHFCATENCAVEILDEFNWTGVRDDMKPVKLGKIIHQDALEDEEVETCEDLDYSHIDDDHQCVYVNLVNNPERFTGYGGAQSFDVWKAIYSENCFPNSNPMEEKVQTESVNGEEPLAPDSNTCIEKNLFYRVVSGMHASIGVHLSNEYLNPTTNTFSPNLKVFMERVGTFNDRLSNIYFNYALVTQAIVKLSSIIPLESFIHSGYDDMTPSQQDQYHLLDNEEFERDDILVNKIIPTISSNTLFDTTNLFTDVDLKNEFRARFKNISAIMDCVGCDRCRMWGKLQTIGYGTALKILFEDPADKIKFRRIELVALINTFDRLSKSIESINNFKIMYLEHLDEVNKGLAKRGEYEKPGSDFAFPYFSGGDLMKKKNKKFEMVNDKKTDETTNKSTKSKKAPKIAPPKPSPIPRTFTMELKDTIVEVLEAALFVVNSFKTFPGTVFHVGIQLIDELWNIFIGKTKFTYESEVSLKKEQDEYLSLFEE